MRQRTTGAYQDVRGEGLHANAIVTMADVYAKHGAAYISEHRHSNGVAQISDDATLVLKHFNTTHATGPRGQQNHAKKHVQLHR